MAPFEFSKEEIQEARLQILAELKQSDRAAAKEAYKRLLNHISNPWFVLMGRMVRGTTAIQRWLNVVIYLNRSQYLVAIFFIVAGVVSNLRYFLGLVPVAVFWWVLSEIQFRLNIELAARLMILEMRAMTTAQATKVLVEAIRESLSQITNSRFFQTERGYQAELYAEIRKRLPAIRGLHEDVIIEQEFQKRANAHGLTLRPDLIIHVPFDNGRHSDRREGNYICFELKLRATAAEARSAYQHMSRLMQHLNYPVGIFVNIDSTQTHISETPKQTEGRFFGFAVSLPNGVVQLHEDNT